MGTSCFRAEVTRTIATSNDLYMMLFPGKRLPAAKKELPSPHTHMCK